MAFSEFRSPKPVNLNDYRYWITRDRGGKVEAYRQLLNGTDVDHSQQPEILSRDELPMNSLREDYDILASGDIPTS